MWVYIVAAVVVGVVFSQQPAINGAMGKTLGSPLVAAIISITISLLGAIALLPLFGSAGIKLTSIGALPWWSVLGGIAGTLIVVGGVVIAPVTGVAVFFVCIVAGQLFGAAIADHLGVFGLEAKPLTLIKMFGLLLVVCGAWLVRLD